MSEPITSNPSMSSAEDSPARTSATPEPVPGSPVIAPAYGGSWPESLGRWDPDTSSWKTSQLCLLGGLETFSEPWPRSGTMQNGIAYRLPPLVPLTGATGSLSWPTPSAGQHNYSEDPDNWLARRERLKAKGINGNGAGMPLGIAVKLWPTPLSRDYRSESCTPEVAAKRAAHPRGKSLSWAVTYPEGEVARFPTPSATDHKGSSKPGQRRGQLTDPAMGAIPAGGQLNPTWVEWLMGFPLGWTDLEDSETP